MDYHVFKLNIAADFNTGRMYSPDGQIIKAKIIKSEKCSVMPEWNIVHTVEFHDTTRGIKGTMEVDGDYVTTDKIMAAYDAGRYTAT